MDEPPAETLKFRLRREVGGLRGFARRLLARRIVRFGLVAALLGLVGFTAAWFTFARGLPSAETLLTYEPPLPTNVRGIDGMPVHSFARERRVELAFDEYPRAAGRAPISRRRTRRSSNIAVSTIRGWPARSSIMSPRSDRASARARADRRSPSRSPRICSSATNIRCPARVREAILARRIENALSKQQILELYLNQIFLGRNAYGVQSAARAYFGKDVDQLALPEMAYLAILPKAPANYSPERHAARAIERRNWVLGQMEKQRLHHR